MDFKIAPAHVAALVVCLAAITFWFFYRRRRRMHALAELVRHSPTSPMATLSFEDAMQLDVFAERIGQYESETLGWHLGLEPAQCAVQGVSIADQGKGVTLLCKMSEAGRRAYESGETKLLVHKGSKELLPVLRDVETGRTFEIMKAHSTKWIRLAEVSSIIVSAAHIISGMDLARKLADVNRKLERLLKARKIDQVATLERIYAMSKERLQAGRTHDAIRALRNYRDELRQIRAVWRRELDQTIQDAPDPAKKARLKFWGRKGRERKLADHINSDLSYIALLYMAHLIDFCLAEATGTTTYLLAHTLPDELRALQQLQRRLDNRANSLRKFRSGLDDARASLNGLCQMLGATTSVVATEHGYGRAALKRSRRENLSRRF